MCLRGNTGAEKGRSVMHNYYIDPADTELLKWACDSKSVEVTSVMGNYMIAITDASGMTWIYFTDEGEPFNSKLRVRLLETYFNEKEKRND